MKGGRTSLRERCARLRSLASLGATARRGQTIIFLVMLVVILAFVVLWNFDVHKILFVKAKSQNAGDAAAVAAARWQGITLNLIGNLNVAQAVAISDMLALDPLTNNFPAARAIAELEARLCLVGPMVGLIASQQAAKNNGVHENRDFTQRLREHARDVRRNYDDPDNGYRPPYVNGSGGQSCWQDYADMLDVAWQQGVVAGPENTRRYSDYIHYNHWLLEPDFYRAIATDNWCWFLHNAMRLLEDYDDHDDWDPLPRLRETSPINSEVFSLELNKYRRLESIPQLRTPGDLDDLVDELEDFAGQRIEDETAYVTADWYCYRLSSWLPWEQTLPTNFPFAGPIKAHYNYTGADAAARVEIDADRLTPGSETAAVTWTAAAKPLGYLDGMVPPNQYGLVLPAFHEVRLIPVDSARLSEAGYYDVAWRNHIEKHLPEYVDEGRGKLRVGCWYCRQLMKWETDAWRKGGLRWLSKYDFLCDQPGSGGSTGGTKRGH